MGLYLSAHPLDKYDTYFEEQTHPMSYIKAEYDNKTITIGGIITNIRTILTKKGDKMAFVKLENKTDEAEFIVFPSVFAEHGAKLVVDNVVRVTGRVNATDKSGRITSDVKLLAENIELVSDDILENYQSTGTKLTAPGISQQQPPKNHNKERLYLLVENPDDVDTLTAIRRLADIHLGTQDVILVLKDGEEKRPLKMPFHVEASDELLTKLKDLLGTKNVVLK